MREILFRGKRADNGEWATSSYPYGTMSSDTMIHDFDHKTIGEYTGMKDGKGVDIYENDIIKNIETWDVAKVKYYPEHGAFMIVWHNEMGAHVGYLGECYMPIWEIIGNTIDNPELIENKE